METGFQYSHAMRNKCLTRRCKNRVEDDRGVSAIYCKSCARERFLKQKREWAKRNRAAARA